MCDPCGGMQVAELGAIQPGAGESRASSRMGSVFEVLIGCVEKGREMGRGGGKRGCVSGDGL
jgi:hypothetical protein